MGDKLKETIEKALFESRPYVEYYDRLRDLVYQLLEMASNWGEFIDLVEREIDRTDEPFKTDLRIFLQKFEGVM